MKRLLFFILSILSVTYCYPPGYEMCYPFQNKSDNDIYFVFDDYPKDNVITSKSECVLVEAGSWVYYYSKGRHHSEIKDSLHIYIIDRTRVDLGGKNRDYWLLTEEQVALIGEGAILERLTRTRTSDPFEYTYNP